ALPHLFHAMGQSWKAAQAVLQRFKRQPERQSATRSAGCILGVVQAAQGSDPAYPADLGARAAGSAPDGFTLDVDPVRKRVFHRHPHHALTGLLDPIGSVAAPAVVDADDRGPLFLDAGDQTLLD